MGVKGKIKFALYTFMIQILKNTFLLQYRGILYLLPLKLRDMIEHNTYGMTIMLVHCPRYI
jgi:hypothetical protein